MNMEAMNNGLLYLNAPKTARDFLVENLGFIRHRYAILKNENWVKSGESYGNLHGFFLNAQENEIGTHNFKLIIITTDCLQDFHNLKTKDIIIVAKPHYVPEGLAFEISDYSNNRYIFLEKRDYTDL